MRRHERSASYLRVWLWPILLAALTMVGLLSALLGQHDVWYWVAWIALSIPLAVILRHVARAWHFHENRKPRRCSPARPADRPGRDRNTAVQQYGVNV